MSDTWTVIVPSDALLIPTADIRRELQDLLTAVECDAVEESVSDHVQFRESGGALEGIMCPECGADISDEWPEMMDAAHDGNGIQLRKIAVSCCGAEAALNELVYSPPQGFSRYELRLRNPRVEELSAGVLRSIAKLLEAHPLVFTRHH